MSPNMKLSMLAFVGVAAAIPQYGVGGHGHGHGHKHSSSAAAASSAHPYPTGGWGNYNSTRPVPVAAGTGSYGVPVVDSTTQLSSVPAGGKTTPAGSVPTGTKSSYAGGVPSGSNSYVVGSSGDHTSYVDEESTITSTTTRTVYLTRGTNSAVPTVANVNAVSSKAPVCGAETVYVTATEKVYVTVPAGGASSSASSSTPKASSAAPVAHPSAPAYEASAPVAPSSSAAPAASSSAHGYEAAEPVVKPSKEEVKPSSTAAAVTSAPYVQVPASSSAAPASSVKPSSAPASKPSSSPGYSGGKRGLAYRYDGAADCKSFENHDFGFVWDWEADTKGDIGKLASKFIPTLRTMGNTGDWASKVDEAIAAGSKVVFGFNEPDIASQTNLGVSALCDAWKTYMNPILEKHSGVTIVGPSVSSSTNAGQGLDYLSSFVEQCKEANFHDINIHWYGPASVGFEGFKAHVEDAASKFPGKKIWCTEFALTGATPQESAAFLKSAQEYLDGNSNVAGYSYFAVGNFDPSFNMLGTASALTETGKVYVS